MILQLELISQQFHRIQANMISSDSENLIQSHNFSQIPFNESSRHRRGNQKDEDEKENYFLTIIDKYVLMYINELRCENMHKKRYLCI
jgi:hypothetical protein